MDGCDLLLKPGPASRNFKRVRLFMQPDFAAQFPFKVLNRIGNVNHGPIDTGRLETLIEQLAGGAHKWFSQLIFAIARLFTHQKDCGMCSSLAKYYLGRVLVEIASTT